MFYFLHNIKILIVGAVIAVTGLFLHSKPDLNQIQAPPQQIQVVSEISVPQEKPGLENSPKVSLPQSKKDEPEQQRGIALPKISDAVTSNNPQIIPKTSTSNSPPPPVQAPRLVPKSDPQQPLIPQCALGAILCNNKCWSSCPTGQEFLCDSTGGVCLVPKITVPSAIEEVPASSTTQRVEIDIDSDGILDSIDIYPDGNSAIESRIYNIGALKGTSVVNHQIRIDIPLDRYRMYKDHFSHTFTNGYTNITSFVTPNDPVVTQIVESIKPLYYNDLNEPYLFYRLVSQILYQEDYKTGLNEYPKYPTETILDGNGDCEDSAFLLASVLKKFGKDVVLIRYSDHLAVGVSMTDAEIKAFDNFITAMNDLFSQIFLLETQQGITDRPAHISWFLDRWNLSHSLQYYNYGGKKYVYLESTSKSLWLDIGQIPQAYSGVSAFVHPIE